MDCKLHLCANMNYIIDVATTNTTTTTTTSILLHPGEFDDGIKNQSICNSCCQNQEPGSFLFIY